MKQTWSMREALTLVVKLLPLLAILIPLFIYLRYQWYLGEEKRLTPLLDAANLEIVNELPFGESVGWNVLSVNGNTLSSGNIREGAPITYGRDVYIQLSGENDAQIETRYWEEFNSRLTKSGWEKIPVVWPEWRPSFRSAEACIVTRLGSNGDQIQLFIDYRRSSLAPMLPEPLVVWSMLHLSGEPTVLTCQ